jgi:hypothetical protein
MSRKKSQPVLPTVKRLHRAVNNDPTQYEISLSTIRGWAVMAEIYGSPNKFTPEDVRAIIAKVKKVHGDTDYTRRIALAWEPYTHEPED